MVCMLKLTVPLCCCFKLLKGSQILEV